MRISDWSSDVCSSDLRLLRTARGRGARTQCGRQDTVAERTLIMPHRFPLALRLLHWTMALLIIAMLFIGAGMVSTAGPAYASLIALHRPLGIAILLLAALPQFARASCRERACQYVYI